MVFYAHTQWTRQGTSIQGHQNNNHQVKTVIRKNMITKSKYQMRFNKKQKQQFSHKLTIYIRNWIGSNRITSNHIEPKSWFSNDKETASINTNICQQHNLSIKCLCHCFFPHLTLSLCVSRSLAVGFDVLRSSPIELWWLGKIKSHKW